MTRKFTRNAASCSFVRQSVWRLDGSGAALVRWRLQFEPKFQVVKLHSLLVSRGSAEIDQSNLEKAHLLQREEGLERFVIEGWPTLLVVREDVRPGDILDFSYTIESRQQIFPEQGAYFFSLPRAASTGQFRFAVRFAPARQRRWKSSSPNLAPSEVVNEGLVRWEWSGKSHVEKLPEANSPPWHVAHA